MKSLIKSLLYFLFAPFLVRKMKSQSIYLTFDDGPYGENTKAILSVLQKSKVRATFFMLGQAMEQYPEIVKELISDGHTLGYHSYKHISLKKRRFKELVDDVAHMNRLSNVFQYPIKLYRPPFGDLTLMAFIYFVLKGKKIIMWSLDSRDSFERLEEVQNIISPANISNGEIILFHDDYDDAEKLITSTLQLYQKANIECDAL